MTKREEAERYFEEGYNCAQSVALAFIEYTGMKKEDLLRSVSGFGGGFGRMREVCGAVSGMTFVCGWIFGYSKSDDVEGKKNVYSYVQLLLGRFKEKNGSVVCRELLGLKREVVSFVPNERTPEYYQTRPCAKLVGDAAEILSEFLSEKGVSRGKE